MSSRSALQNDAGTSQSNWHKSDTARSPNVLPVTHWKLRRWGWLQGVMADRYLSANAKVLASVLALQFASSETGKCFPGNAVLVEAMGLKSEDTLQRAFKALAAQGWLQRTEGRGRGRGNKHEVTFLQRPQALEMSSHSDRKTGKSYLAAVDKTADCSIENTEEIPAELQVEEAEIAADLRSNTRKSAASRNNLNFNQKERAPKKIERPNCPVEAVPYGSDAESEWNAYLQAHNLPKLSELNQKFSDDRGCGWKMPRRRPPHPDDATANRVALSFARWCAFQKGFIQ